MHGSTYHPAHCQEKVTPLSKSSEPARNKKINIILLPVSQKKIEHYFHSENMWKTKTKTNGAAKLVQEDHYSTKPKVFPR